MAFVNDGLVDDSKPKAVWPTDRIFDRAAAFVIASYAAVLAFVFRDYGITYDEPWHRDFGDRALAWYASGFEDRRILEIFDFMSYGCFFDLSAQALSRCLPIGVYESRHLLGAMFGLAAVAGVTVLTRSLAGPRAAFVAALLAASTPRLFGHAFNNPKDVPFAAMTTWSLVATLSLVRSLPRPGLRRMVVLGGLIGLAVGIRIGGLILLGYLALALVLSPRRPAFIRLAGIFAATAAVATVVTYLFYPAFQDDPIGGPLHSIRRMKHGSSGTFPVLFEGMTYRNDELPRRYVWSWLVRCLPDSLAVGLSGAVIAAIAWFRRGANFGERQRHWAVVVLAAFLPFIVVTITSPVLYDEIRHFRFCKVLFTVMAAAGSVSLLDRMKSSVLRAVVLATLLGGVALTTFDAIRLHPYQTAYFNRLIGGGLARSGKVMETDYWGNAFREGAMALNRLGASNGGRRPRIISSCFPDQTSYYLDANRFDYVGSYDHDVEIIRAPYDDPPDYYIGSSRWNRLEVYPGRVVHRVEREGITLLVVVEVDREAALAKRR